MGASLSSESPEPGASSVDELSRSLAHRFATKCFTQLELTHLKDNFFSRALDQGGIRYWNEEILSEFLGIPDGAGSAANAMADGSLDAGPVIFRMVSYLGAFPFQNTMAPSVLTFEALVKVVVLLTERYGKVLRRGRRDRVKLLFGSLADVGRKDIALRIKEAVEDTLKATADGHDEVKKASHAAGFEIDEPANDEEEEDDDDLALAALESLDAIEVFKHDQRIDRTVYESKISIDTFRRLLTLLLVTAPLRPLGTVSKYTTGLSKASMEAVHEQVESIIAALEPGDAADGIGYRSFSKLITTSLPYLFDPLTPLFEHLLFSKNLDLSRKRNTPPASEGEEGVEKIVPEPPSTLPSSPPLSPLMLPGGFNSCILNPALLSHLSFFLSTSSQIPNIFRNRTQLHPVFSSTEHGESLTSFSHHVMTWEAPTLLLIKGSTTNTHGEETIATIGAYLPQPWKSSTTSTPRRASTTHGDTHDPSSLPCLFELLPTHTILHGSPSLPTLNPNKPVTSFSTKTGIAIGCQIPPRSRTSHGSEPLPKPAGGGSLLIDAALEIATFVVSDGLSGEGVFLPPGVSPTSTSMLSADGVNSTRTLTIYNLEVWGVLPSQAQSQSQSQSWVGEGDGQDAIAMQRARWDFEAREAERRRNINMKVGGGEGAEQSGRALLEMAGIIGDGKYGGRRG
ncbi:Restriction of telomere capping protein 5 [Onygenales sp. PD_40]|nr:Restriction of telomere capping protein 5 [Onygenales sp. PD_40]KAK2771157.1 Restriction of telomere capping protein 5 [Emmonsiellopsis sp. PD_33]KAK2792371.1 Restriction of telomere capping protein 5 [Onygenales sp. PD_10]KAK2795779.1 Restriction of telomere capping protein 5 [Onygenales sp. PD_12]